MALTPNQAVVPDDVKKALHDYLPAFKSFESANKELQDALLQAGQGLKVFTMGVPDVLTGGKGLAGAKLSGWRIATGNTAGALAADIYTMPTTSGSPVPTAPRLACVRTGPEIQNMLQAITDLTKPPLSQQLPAAVFDVHALIMPGLYTDALWLQPTDPSSATSYIVPFQTLVDGVTPQYAYTEDELIAHLRPIAEKWVSYKPKTPYINRSGQAGCATASSQAD